MCFFLGCDWLNRTAGPGLVVRQPHLYWTLYLILWDSRSLIGGSTATIVMYTIFVIVGQQVLDWWFDSHKCLVQYIYVIVGQQVLDWWFDSHNCLVQYICYCGTTCPGLVVKLVVPFDMYMQVSTHDIKYNTNLNFFPFCYLSLCRCAGDDREA